MIKNISKWTNLVSVLVGRDLKIRYRGSFLGYLWSMLNPLLTMSILTLVFSKAMRVQLENYALYVLIGLLCWNFFNQSCVNGVNGIVGNSSLLKKVKVPSWVFPSATILSAGIHMLLALIPYFLITFYFNLEIGMPVIQFPLILFLFFLFIQGFVSLISTLNVFFRDIAHVLEPVLQLGFYASPILYPMSIVPEQFQPYLKLNPIYYFLEGFRASFFSSEWVTPQTWAIMTAAAILSFVNGAVVYSKSQDQFLYHV